MLTIVRRTAWIAAALVATACAGGSASLPSAAPSRVAPTLPGRSIGPSAMTTAASASAGARPTTFTSSTYGYSLALPAGWTAIQATKAWDGTGAPFHDEPVADQFVGTGPASAWFFAAPTTKDLAGRVQESIAANAAGHANTCPAVPQVNDPIDIGGQPGTLLGFDCGILINTAITVHKGVAYLFGFRDPSVHAATDPTDRATFQELLTSVRYPD